MNSTLYRQLKDIQYQAERLASGKKSAEVLEDFSNYNEEIKLYLLTHIDNIEIVNLVKEIPNVLEVETETKSTSFFVTICLSIFTLGVSAIYLANVAEMRRIHLVQSNIQTARGKYASIEFLLRASE